MAHTSEGLVWCGAGTPRRLPQLSVSLSVTAYAVRVKLLPHLLCRLEWRESAAELAYVWGYAYDGLP